MFNMSRRRRRLTKILLVFCAILIFWILLRKSTRIDEHHGINLVTSEAISDCEPRQIQNLPKPWQNDVPVCRYPLLDPWNKEMMKFFNETPPMNCAIDHMNWVEVTNGRIVIVPRATEQFGMISCQLVPFVRISKDVTEEGPSMDAPNNFLIPTDFFRINCRSASGKTYSNIHAGIHRDENLRNKKNSVETGLGLDVLMIGFDSVSRMTFMRKLPLTYKYLLDTMGAVVLNGYNIVGDGTPQALIPILTGKTELEMPRPLKRLNSTLHVNIFPFAWKNFSRKGYVTAWSEDRPDMGCFTYRMTGFKEQPTDHYMRTFYNKVQRSEDRPFCIGDRHNVRVILDWARDFMRDYRNSLKFGFTFHNDISHDGVEYLETGDIHLRDTLRTLNTEGLLCNTMLVVMSDHGSRFMKGTRIRTVQGKQEERNPFFSITLPKWFHVKYPEAFVNLLRNSERLVTPFDIHETLLDNLHFKGTGRGDKRHRGISLFQEIPLDRTCQDAGVEPHWCNCLQWSPLNTTDQRALAAAGEVVRHINDQTMEKRDVCVELSIAVIERSAIFEPAKDMLAFLRTDDDDGFRADLGDNMTNTNEIIQLTILTSPNNGLYEVTVTHNIESGIYTIQTGEISRINKYGDDPHCVSDSHEELRKFCLCKDGMKRT